MAIIYTRSLESDFTFPDFVRGSAIPLHVRSAIQVSTQDFRSVVSSKGIDDRLALSNEMAVQWGSTATQSSARTRTV